METNNNTQKTLDLTRSPHTAPQELSQQESINDPKSNSSRIRDHLANERTYLAWMRTAIALMGFGVVIARLRYILAPTVTGTGHGWALGLLFALSGLLTVLLSTQHYFSIRQAIDADTYEPTSRWVIIFSLMVLLLGTGVLYVLLTVPNPLMSPQIS